MFQVEKLHRVYTKSDSEMITYIRSVNGRGVAYRRPSFSLMSLKSLYTSRGVVISFLAFFFALANV